ncbi:MAG: hypothetical protein K9L79_00415 [Methylobacter tundripaludum]|nr:hypothetical protein [Methylobacter tundripaludum]
MNIEKLEEITAVVRECIEDSNDPATAGHRIIVCLTEQYGLQFTGETTNLWITLLCKKWHDKTPDIDAQADGITRAIMNNTQAV